MTVRKAALGLGALALVGLLVWVPAQGPYWVGLFTVVLAYAVASMGLDLVNGYGGMLSIAQATFFGIGAYAIALGHRDTSLPGVVLLLAGMVIAGVLALLVGMLVVRRKGNYFALLTLALTLVGASLVNASRWTGGPAGVVVGQGTLLSDTGTWSPPVLYWLGVGLALVVLVALRSLRQSPAGRALAALRSSDELARSVGVNVDRLRLKAFVAGGQIGVVAGALFAYMLRHVAPEALGLGQSITFLVINVIGGMGTAWGSIVGALVVQGLPQALQGLQDWKLLGVGAVMLAVLLRFPAGIAGTIEQQLRKRPEPVVAEPRDTGTEATRPAVDPAPATAAREPLLVAEGVSRSFEGLVALSDVDVVVRAGELHALIGPNGAGKSTLVNCLSGTDRPDEGRIMLSGRDVTSLPADARARLGVARTFQLISLCPDLTVLENVVLGGARQGQAGLLRGMAPTIVRRCAETRERERGLRVLERVGLAAVADRLPEELSAGQRRLAEVGRCLASGAEVLLLDEPAAGLNEVETGVLAELLTDICAEGKAVLLIEHDMNLVMRVSHVVTVINFGAVICKGTPSEVSSDPAVRSAYLGAATHG